MSSISPFDHDRAVEGTNLSAKITNCRTCHGDRFVTVRLRSPEQTAWMNDHKITAPKDRFFEEVAPCPDCNPIVVEYFLTGGSRFRSMDATAAREALRS